MIVFKGRICKNLKSGGPDGELAASLRYLNQRYTMPYEQAKGTLTDIGVSVSVGYILNQLSIKLYSTL